MISRYLIFIGLLCLSIFACKENKAKPEEEFLEEKIQDSKKQDFKIQEEKDNKIQEEQDSKKQEGQDLKIQEEQDSKKQEGQDNKIQEGQDSKKQEDKKQDSKIEDKKVKDESAQFRELNKGFVIDIKYATKDNFTKKQIYPCGKCYLRPEVATAIEKANQLLKERHKYSLKMFDCYRPRPAQQRLWDVVPNADYVTPPAKGSMHNKGLAVDLTIVDEKGKDLDMGTPYDFFGKEAHTDNFSLPKQVLDNRKLLTGIMKEVGLSGIRTEWWHFSYPTSAALSDWEWPCE